MWLNSRDLSGGDDEATVRDGVWGFTSSTPSSMHGAIGASGSRAIWNRMEPAEEEREEEALPSYLSYLQPAFRPAAITAEMHVPSSQPPSELHAAMRGAPGLPGPSPNRAAAQVVRKSSELAQALEHLVLDTVQRHLGDGPAPDTQAMCRCNCDAMREQMQQMAMQVLTLQTQVLEMSKHSIPTAIEVSRVPSTGNWSANAPPFVPKQFKNVPPPPAPVDQTTATVLSDRISTLEGRQSAFQSQLAQIAKVLGIPTGKPGKHSPVKHLVQTLRDEVDAKVEQATAEVTAQMNAVLKDVAASKSTVDERRDTRQALSSNVVLAALASEHEASLARLSESFEELLAEEARQRAALEARIKLQLSQHEEWLQQLEGVFESPHDPKLEPESRSKILHKVNIKLEALEQKCDECRELYQQVARNFPDDESRSRFPRRPSYNEEENDLGQSS